MKRQLKMPYGLPSSLSSGKDGFDRLCTLLDIMNREEKQAVAKLPIVRDVLKHPGFRVGRGLKTADRLRAELTALHEQRRQGFV